MSSAPASLKQLAARVDVRLDEFLAAERDRWASFDSELAHPIEEIRRLVLSGGKRLRPAFCHWGYVGAGGGDNDQIDIDAGAAFELRFKQFCKLTAVRRLATFVKGKDGAIRW